MSSVDRLVQPGFMSAIRKKETVERYFKLSRWVLALVICHTSCKAPEAIQRTDTLVITQERVLVDTLEIFKDTTIFQDRVKVRIEYLDNFVKVQADCPSDTIKVQTVKQVYNTKELERSRQWVGGLFMVALVLFILLLLKR